MFSRFLSFCHGKFQDINVTAKKFHTDNNIVAGVRQRLLTLDVTFFEQSNDVTFASFLMATKRNVTNTCTILHLFTNK